MVNKLIKLRFQEYCSLFCIIALFINKNFSSNEPLFYYGKFNIFQTSNINLTDIIVITISLFFISNCYRKKIKIKINSELTLFFIILFVTSYKIAFISALMFSIILLNSHYKKNLNYFLYNVYFQISLAFFQFTTQSNTNISILNFFGEPILNPDTKGIAKVRISTFEIMRSYGTAAHPNILASYISIAFLMSKNVKTKIAAILSLISVASISNIVSLVIANFSKLKIRKSELIIILTFVIALILTFGIRLSDNRFESIEFRVNQTTQYILQESNFKQILFGNNTLNANNKMLPWDIQPIHNSYLFLISQHGLIALILLLYLIKQITLNNTKIAIFLILILLFDHYWFSITNGALLFTLIYIFALQSSEERRISS